MMKQIQINDNDMLNTNLAFEKLGLSSNSSSSSSLSYMKKKRKRTISENTNFDSFIFNVSSFSNMTLDDEITKKGSVFMNTNDINDNNESIVLDDARNNALSDTIYIDFEIDDRYLSSFITNPIESFLISNFLDDYQAFTNKKLSIFPYFYIKCLQEYTLYRIFKVFFMINIENNENNQRNMSLDDDFNDFIKYFSFLRSNYICNSSMNIDENEGKVEKIRKVNEYSQLCLMIRNENLNVNWFNKEKVGLLGICYLNLRKRLYENCINKKKGLFNQNNHVLKKEITSEEFIFQIKNESKTEKTFLSHKRNKSNDNETEYCKVLHCNDNDIYQDNIINNYIY